MPSPLVHTAIALIKQATATIGDVDALQSALDELRHGMLSGMEVAPGGTITVKRPSPQKAMAALAKKKKWTATDRREALTYFKPSALPKGMYEFLTFKQGVC